MNNVQRSTAAKLTFESRATEKHLSKYTYERVEYINCKTAVEITCPVHGIFRQTPNHHLSGFGCPVCGRSKITQSTHRRISNDLAARQAAFIERSVAVHGGKYDYTNTKYINAFTPVDIVCSTHGTYSQLPTNHTRGSGCAKCGVERLSGGYTEESFALYPAIKTQPAKLYLVQISEHNSTFLKIGITVQTISSRLSRIKSTGLNFSIIQTWEMQLFEAFQIEQHIKSLFTTSRYFPNTKFDGYTECFKMRALPALLDEVHKKL